MAEERKFISKGEIALTQEEFNQLVLTGGLIPGKKYYIVDLDHAEGDGFTTVKDDRTKAVTAVGLAPHQLNKNESNPEFLSYAQIKKALTITRTDGN